MTVECPPRRLPPPCLRRHTDHRAVLPSPDADVRRLGVPCNHTVNCNNTFFSFFHLGLSVFLVTQIFINPSDTLIKTQLIAVKGILLRVEAESVRLCSSSAYVVVYKSTNTRTWFYILLEVYLDF